MNFKDFKISRLLQVGMGMIALMVAVLGGVAWWQSNSMWQEIDGLYNHPLTVRRAIGELQVDVLSMYRAMQDLVQTPNDVKLLETSLQKVDTYEADVFKQFTQIYDRYLGPRSDIDTAYQAFVGWKALRQETLRLIRTGETLAALQRVAPGGEEDTQINRILADIQTISQFATERGDRFYQDALTQRIDLQVQLGVVTGVILLLAAAISYFMIKRINDPLHELTQVTGQYRQGHYDVRSRYVPKNEFGVLSASFNDLAATVQVELDRKASAARVADSLMRTDELHAFCQEMLEELLSVSGSQLGAVYLLNESKTAYEHCESIGLAEGARASFSAGGRQGEFGAALASGEIQCVEIPAETRFVFNAVSGDLQPRQVITIPILTGREVTGLVSLAALQPYPQAALRLVKDVWEVLTARMNSVLALQKVKAFSERLEGQNRELQMQSRELATQRNELTEQNIELGMQKNQLDEANRMKSAFLSNMSHELRTPLNSVIALAGVLNRRLRGVVAEEEYSYLGVIERNGRSLLELINDILDLSRIEAGHEEVNLSTFSPGMLVGEVVEMLEPQAREKNLPLVTLVRDGLPEISSDYIKCRHILQNLAGNAVKFTERGQVNIRVERAGKTVQFQVKDTGIGISAEYLPFIFDEFRQADESTSRRYGGSGLGLAIARKYAALLGGEISVESTPGVGSTFTLRLPLTWKDSGAQSAPPSDRDELAAPGNGNGKMILVVEDSAPAVIQLQDILGEQGYRVLVAGSGREALAVLDETTPDGLILDLMMPEVDGFEVLRMVRAREKTATLPVLILTAKQVSPQEMQSLRGNHIQQLIQKGDVNKKDLLGAVARMVRPPEAAVPPAPRRPGPDAPVRATLLIVEDNPDNLITLHALLGNSYTLLDAGDGLTALEKAKSSRPDLILMDLSLPGKDGFQSFDLLRAEEGLRQIPVVALTARAMKGDREICLAYGFDGYIAKPIDEETLMNTIQEILHGRK